MARVADSTIKGFMYQFNLSLNEILNSNDEIIRLEGLIEDIDKVSTSEVTAIQCKYHESAEVFSWSIVYKPILQMLKTFAQTDSSNIRFVLYAYFPREKQGIKDLTTEIIEGILNTQNVEYICDYIAFIKEPTSKEIKDLVQKSRKSKADKKKIAEYYNLEQIVTSCDIDEFITKRFTFRIGKEYDELTKENIKLLGQAGFEAKDIEDFVYPNAIQKIATMSMLKEYTERSITKDELISELEILKKTAISRWTKELANYRKLLIKRRSQLSAILNINLRKRCLVFDPTSIENFDDGIVVFIKKFIDFYCRKTKLRIPAILCILSYDRVMIDSLVGRLYKKDIDAEIGFRGNIFYADAFNREPVKKIREEWMEFRIKICGDLDDCIDAINCNKQDDIFQFAKKLPENLSIQDVNIEVLDIQNFEQIEYLLKMRDEVEA